MGLALEMRPHLNQSTATSVLRNMFAYRIMLMNKMQMQTKILLCAFPGLWVARSYAPTNVWFLVPIAIAIWWAAVHKRGLFDYMLFAFFYSFVFWLIHLYWLEIVGVDAFIGLAIIMTLIYTLCGYLMFLVKDLPLPYIWYALIFISLETATDYLPFGGFPWGKIAYVSADAPWANLFPIGSAPLVSAAILTISILLIKAYEFSIKKSFSPAVLILIVILAFNISINQVYSFSELSKGKIDLAIIQGSTPRSGLLFNEQKMEVLNYHVAETNRLFARNNKNIDLILWPENSIDVDPFKNDVALKSIKSVLNSHGKPLLSGAVLQGKKGLSNTVLLWNPDSQTVQDSYVKSKLVPFGEYLPYREVLTKYIKRFELIPQDFIPGGEANNIAIGKAKISPIVCYEIAWNNSLFDQIEQGGQLISVHTNNATYVFSHQLDQQFMITRIRAMETAREVVVTSTTGISAHIDNRGKVLWQSKIFAPDSKVVSASLYNEITPAVRYRNEISLIGLWGWLLPMLLLVIRYFYRKK